MKILIYFFLLLYCVSIGLSQNYNKQKERVKDFWNYRKEFLVDQNYILNYYKELKAFIKKDKFNSDIKWNEIGPRKFVNETNLNYGFGRLNCIKFNPLDSNEIWAGSAGGGLWIYNIKDKTWRNINETNFFSIGISDIAFSASEPNKVYLATGDARGGEFFRGYTLGILRSIDNGKTFNSLDEIIINNIKFIKKVNVHPLNSDLIYLGSDKGLYSFNFQTKTLQTLITNNFISDIEFHPENPDIIYVSTANKNINYVYKTTDGGNTFSPILEIKNSNRIELYTIPSSPSALWVLSDKFYSLERANLFYSSDEGNSFQNLLSSEFARYLVGGQGFYNLMIAINNYNPNEIYIGGVPLHFSTNGGKTFEIISNNIHVDQHDLIFDNSGNIYLANDGGLYRSTNKGYTWENLSEGLGITQFYNVGFNPINPELVFAGSQDNGLIRFYNENANHSLSGDAMDIVIPKNKPNYVFSVLQSGQVYISENLGKEFKWSNITENIDEIRPWNTKIYITDNADSIFVAFKNIWLSTDYGKNWTKLTSFNSPNDTVIIKDFLIDNNEIIFSKGSILLKINTEGETNIVRNLNNYITSIIKVGNDIYLSLGDFQNNLKVAKLENKEKLINLTYNLPRIPINKIIYQPKDSIFYLATDAGIYTKTYHSNNWDNFSNSIGYPIVTDIELDSINGVLYASTFGRGLWKMDLNYCEKDKIQLNINKDIKICSSDSIFIEVLEPRPEINYQWSNGEKGNKVKIKEPSTIFCYYKNESNCFINSKIINVDYYDKNLIKLRSLTKNPECEGNPVIVEAITPKEDSLKVYWSDGQRGNIGKFYKEGEYKAYIISKNGCTDSSFSFNISFNKLPDKPILKLSNYLLKIENFNYENHINWYFNDSLIKDYHIAQLYPFKSGKYYAEIIDTNYCKSYSDTIEIKSDFFIFSPIIFPNPADDYLNLSFFTNLESNIDISIHSLLGGFYNFYKFKSILGLNTFRIDIRELSIGVYFLEIKFNKQDKVLMFVKNK